MRAAGVPSGDTNEDGFLDGANTTPETWTFTCTRAVEGSETGDTDTNVAVGPGVDPLGNSYEDTDDAVVRVITPAIALTKSPSATLVPAGSDVTYTFEARNVGTSDIAADDVLEDVVLVDLAVPRWGRTAAPPTWWPRREATRTTSSSGTRQKCGSTSACPRSPSRPPTSPS